MSQSFVSIICVVGLSLSACGQRQFSPRSTNPLIEDRVRLGDTRNSKMSVLTTRADRRTILILEPGKVCAEPSPDVAEAVFAEAKAKAEVEGAGKFEGSSTLQTAIMQLTRRSQGLDYIRSSSFIYCMMWYNGVFEKKSEYVAAMDYAFKESVRLTELEIKNLPAIATATLQVAARTDEAAAAKASVPANNTSNK